MAMDDATLIKPSSAGFILRAVTNNEEFPLDGEMIVGREAECAIAIKSGHISRYHAKINVMRSGVYIEDLHSTNGTFINGRKIKGRVLVSLGDEITFDDVAFRIVSSQSGQEEQTLLAPARFRNNEENTIKPIRKTANVEPISKPQPSMHIPAQAAPRRNHNLASFGGSHNHEDMPPAVNNVSPSDAAPNPASSIEAADMNEAAMDEPSLESPAVNAPEQASADLMSSASHAAPHPAEPRAEPKEIMAEAEDHTRMLSGSQIEQYVERNRAIHKDVNVGNGPRLIIMTAPLRGKCFEFENAPISTEWQIGRSPESDIHLTDKTISGDHARLTRLPDGFLLSATHAKNGILINGQPQGKTYLQHRDKIQIGGTELLFKTDYPVAEPAKSTSAIEEQSHNLRHAIIGGAVILVALITVLITSKG